MANVPIQPDSTTIWERVWSSPLGREISIALTVKLLALGIVWWAFFSDPIDHDLDHRDIERVMIAPSSAAAGSSVPASISLPARDTGLQ